MNMAVLDKTTGIQYASLTEAAAAINCSRRTIQRGFEKNRREACVFGHDLLFKQYNSYVEWALDNPNGKREKPEKIQAYLRDRRSKRKKLYDLENYEDGVVTDKRMRIIKEVKPSAYDPERTAVHYGGIKIEPTPVMIAEGTTMGTPKAERGLLEAYLGKEHLHPWKVRFGKEWNEVVYVESGGITDMEGNVIRPENLA